MLSELVAVLQWFLNVLYTRPLEVLGTIALFLLIYFTIYPEKFERFVALVYRLLAPMRRWFSKRYIAYDIQGKINSQIKKINKESNNALPYGIKVRWTDVDTAEAEIRRGKVVVIMKDYKNQSVNMARAALAYTSMGLIPKSRSYVKPDLMRTIDYIVARKLVEDDAGARKYLEASFEEEKTGNPRMGNYMNLLIPIDEQGLLTRLLLYDFRWLGDILHSYPNKDVHEETVKYTEFVHRIVTKQPGEDVPLMFPGRYIKTNVILVARETSLAPFSHVTAIQLCVKRGATTIHVLAAGSNITLAKAVVTMAKNDLGLIKVREEEYKSYYHPAQKKMSLYHAILEMPTPGSLNRFRPED